MPASYTSLLKFAKPGLGDTGWGTTVNGGFTDMTEQALTGYVQKAVTVAGPNTIPTIADGASSDGRNQFIELTGTLASPATLTVPAGTLVGSAGNNKLYFIKNSAGDAVTITTGGANTVVVPNGKSMMLRVTNTGVEVVADQFVNLNASGNVSFDGGAFVFNDSGADKDARFEGDTDANLLFLDASTDRVGIGTNTPSAKLTVDGTATVTGDVLFDGGTFVFNDSGADKDARFEGDTDANLLFLDASTDRVGIGTAAPAAKLDVDGAAIVRGFLTPTDAIKLGANTSAPSTTDAFIYRPADNTLAFGTASTERMRLDSSGNLGVGTTTPGKKLEVSGSILCTNNNGLAIRSSVGTSNDVVTLDSSNVLIFGGGGGINSLQFWNNGLERARIDSNGSFITSVNNVAPSLLSNNTLSFELTSNTSLKIVVRGTDGVTRSVSLTLS